MYYGYFMNMNLSPLRKEILIIVVAWVLVFASAPLYMCYALVAHDVEFDWNELFELWSYQIAFLLMFLLNHFLLVPKLVGRKLIWYYVVSVVVMLLAFVGYMRFMTDMEHSQHRGDRLEMSDRPFQRRPDELHDAMPMPLNMEDERQDKMHPDMKPPRMPKKRHLLLAPPDMARLLIALLMLGVDLGGIAWLNEQKMRQRLLMLEQNSLKQELEHLRYQINPHFFMNTLNNIHVLVDVDQNRAKRAIVELSGLMRYALYEGNNNLVPLSHEIEFLNLYISLMRLRYSNRLKITCEMPSTSSAEMCMPPMLLATFVENAFKHGVSYQEESFIRVKLTIDDNRMLRFMCINSRHAAQSATQDGNHGIGLENVRKQLELQYADRYSLTIDDKDAKMFAVELILPLSKS